jgi:hypothetical protein
MTQTKNDAALRGGIIGAIVLTVVCYVFITLTWFPAALNSGYVYVAIAGAITGGAVGYFRK